MTDAPESGKKYAFEEFKLFYDSTEKVTDRRLSANTWNYSICTAILIAISALINWGLSKPTFLAISAVSVILLCGMAVLFCSLWIGQIRDFKALNNAKFNILNHMAPHVCFGESGSDPRVSSCPFEREWIALQEANAIQEVSGQKVIALKASNMEYLIPKAFRVLFVGILISLLVFAGFSWQRLFNSSTFTVEPQSTVLPTK
jgi:hypothetical protein